MVNGFGPGLCCALALALAVPQAGAQSWLDSDFYCRTYGCVIVHDGFTFDVYDVYRFDGGGTVGPGEPLVPWSGNPFQGGGRVNPVVTGSRTEAFTLAPLVEEGSMLGVDLDGDGSLEFQPTANASGFIDATSVMPSFTLGPGTRIRATETSSRRSFYLSSRTDFYLSGEVIPTGNGPAGDPGAYDGILFEYDIVTQGNDDGMAFGGAAHRGNSWRRPVSVNTLADLLGAPTYLVEFRRDIRQRSSNSLPAQSVRFDYVYGFDEYDLSMGAGALQYRLEFDIYNR